MLTPNLDEQGDSDTGIAGNAFAASAATGITKVESGSYVEIDVDNGWVLYQGTGGKAALNFFNAATAPGSFSLSASPLYTLANGNLYFGGGIVFAPCAAAAKNRCGPSLGGTNGVGLGFGQISNGGAAVSGWVSDNALKAYPTNPDSAQGSINALAVSAANGAYAVGWDFDKTGSSQAIAVRLDSSGQTYAPVAQTYLGTLGGTTSQALGISQGATYIAGIAATATNKDHAVYTPTASLAAGCGPITNGAVSTCWIDLAPAIASAAAPADVIKSRALVANDAGYIAGSFTVTETLYPGTAGQRRTAVDIGFVYNVTTATLTTFGAPAADVEPLQVLNDGSVVGNLITIPPKRTAPGLPLNHPFIAKNGGVTDFGLLTNATTGRPEYSCRVNTPNHLGELVGACIPTATTAYGAGTAFYIDATAASPAYVDLNAAIHAINDKTVPADKPYVFTTATAIDDEHEIAIMGVETAANGTVTRAGFLAEPGSY